MDVLEWSRHHRCFPGQGTLDVPAWSPRRWRPGYRGPLSLEVFSDVVREADPDVTARDAKRSLVFLEDLPRGGCPTRERCPGPLPLRQPPRRTDAAFVEIADPDGLGRERWSDGSGFARVGDHRSKPVDRWRNGDAHLVLNRAPAAETADDRPRDRRRLP